MADGSLESRPTSSTDPHRHAVRKGESFRSKLTHSQRHRCFPVADGGVANVYNSFGGESMVMVLLELCRALEY